MKTVAFFNHKGGVGKTTLVFNVGLALAREGKNVLFIDADAQANLTGAALPMEKLEDILANEQTIYGALEPVLQGTGDFLDKDIVQIRDRAFILPGDIRLSAFEEILPLGWTESLAGAFRGFQVTTAVYRLIQHMGEKVGADYTFVDLGPNVGALNRSIMIGADGFVVPLAPDLFSLTALPSVGKSVSQWVLDWEAAVHSAGRRGTTMPTVMPPGKPSPLGYVNQQFTSYKGAPTAAFQRWSERIPDAYEQKLVVPLREVGVTVPEGAALMGEVRNLQSLIPIAQQGNKAIFELTGTQARGAQITRAQDTYGMFADIANTIVARLEQ